MGTNGLNAESSFGAWVRNRRQAMSWTRTELAKKIGCAPVTIKKIESDERKPSRQIAELLAEHLLIPRVERERFINMARGFQVNPADRLHASLRIPPYLQQDNPQRYPASTDFVERHKELSRLEEYLDKALAGNAIPAFILGEAGSGKTTLMRQFARMASEAHPDLLVVGGQCNAQTGPGDPYRPFRDILGILTGNLEIDWTVGMLDREQALRIWAVIPEVIQAMAASGPHLFDILLPILPLIQRIAPYLGADTGWFDQFQASASSQSSQPANLGQGQVLEELTQVFRTVASVHPLLLITDDLQWADDASLNVLYHLTRRLSGSRILLLCAYRTGEDVSAQPRLQTASGETHSPMSLILEMTRQYGDVQVRLDQTSPREGRDFINSLLDLEPNRLGQDFREDLYSHTQGHPLFTVEMLNSMRQNKNIVQDAHGYWVENRSSLPAPRPARIEAMIEQRLAALKPIQREVLDIASVDGERFTNEIIASVLDLNPAETLKLLTHDLEQENHLVQEQGLLHVGSINLNRFQFHHMLIQEYLYSRLAPGEKRRLHGRFAAELERTLSGLEPDRISSPDNRDPREAIVPAEYLDIFGPSLLRHFWMGENWSKAAAYAHHLGKRARQRYAMREAIAYYEQALMSLENLPEKKDEWIFDVLLDRQEAAFKFEPYDDQLTRLTQAEEIVRRLDDKPRLIQALHWKANVLLAQGRWTQAGPSLMESLSLAEALGNEEFSIRPAYFRALMTTFADPSQALEWIHKAEDLAHKYGILDFEGLALATEGHVLAQLGEFKASDAAIERARKISDRLGSPLLESDVDLYAAWASLAMDNLEQALELGQRSVDKAIATDNMDCICSGMDCIGYINLGMGRIPEAAAAFEKGIERSDLTDAVIPKLNGQAGLAMTHILSGRAGAIEELEQIVRDMKSVEFHVGVANANLVIGNYLFQGGDVDRASDHLLQAVDFYRRARMLPYLGKALRSFTVLLNQQNRHTEAEMYEEEAKALVSLTGTVR